MQPMSRRAALSMLASAGAALLPTAADAGSVQCPHIKPAPTATPRFHGPTLGELARAKGLMFGIEASITSMHDYGGDIYDPAYLQLILNEKPDFLAFGGQFIFSSVASDPPQNDVLRLTNAAYGIENTWYVVNDIAPKLQAAHVGARADALFWESDQSRQPWLKRIAQGSSPDRRKNPDLDWNLSRAEDYLRIAFDKFDELAAAAPGFVRIVSLVNEPLDPWTLKGRLAYRGGAFAPPGMAMDDSDHAPGYIRDLFRLAGKLRGSKGRNRPSLIINEAGTEDDQYGPTMRPALLSLLKRMLADGLPLDGVGLECHLQPQMMRDPLRPDWSAFGAFMDEVAALGLEIHLTELDVFDYVVSCNGRSARSEEADRLVSLYYESFLTQALKCKAVKSVCLWDLSDRYSFYRALDVSTWYGYDKLAKGEAPADWPKCARVPSSPQAIACPRPNVYDDAYRPKAARAAVIRALESAPVRG